jgi:hypothetical protein
MNESFPPFTSAPPAETSPSAGGFAKFASWFSLLAPFAVVGIYVVTAFILYKISHSSPIQGRGAIVPVIFIFVLPLLLALLGLVLGIVAITQTKRLERKGFFGIAIVGVCLNGLLLVLLVLAPFMAVAIWSKYRSAGGRAFTPEARLSQATNTLASTPDGKIRFYALNVAAKGSFNAGKYDDASRYATELLTMAEKYPKDWNYGNAIQDGNLVLGRLAVRDGRLDEAKQLLLAAGRSKGSPQMDSFGPNMSLAKDLLEKGERDTVLQYFELCRKFWNMDYGKLDQWRDEVKAGKVPSFGANLVY